MNLDSLFSQVLGSLLSPSAELDIGVVLELHARCGDECDGRSLPPLSKDEAPLHLQHMPAVTSFHASARSARKVAAARVPSPVIGLELTKLRPPHLLLSTSCPSPTSQPALVDAPVLAIIVDTDTQRDIGEASAGPAWPSANRRPLRVPLQAQPHPACSRYHATLQEMASHESSRKKRKMSYADSRSTQPTHAGAVASSSALLPTNPAMSNAKANAPCQHEQTLRALNTDLDAMRQLITCKICDRLLYEPYALSCGHTYCYSCLSQWLGSNAKMTCPDCRTVVRQQPTPSYLIRELVLVFVSRNELLPDGETADEHNKAVREEAEIVAKDKANTDRRTGGLFKGRFNRSRLHVLGPLRDPGDGVDRCPGCHWELEDGHCNHCGFEADDLDDDFSLDGSDDVPSDEELDHEVGDMDEDAFVGADGDPWALDGHYHYEHDGGALDMGLGNPRFFPVPPRPGPIELLGSSDEESEDDDYDHNDTFIDDDAIEGSDASDAESDVTAGRNVAPPPGRRNLHGRPAPVVISDDEDDESVEAPPRRFRLSPGLRRRAAPVAVSDEESEDGDETAPSTVNGADGSESDSEDEGPIVRGSQRNKRPSVAVRSRRAVTVTSSDDSEDEDESQHEHDQHSVSEATEQGGFSPIDDGFGDGVSESTDYDDDYGGELADGLAAPEFNPYEPDDASAGGYEDDSSRSDDDGWGSLAR